MTTTAIPARVPRSITNPPPPLPFIGCPSTDIGEESPNCRASHSRLGRCFPPRPGDAFRHRRLASKLMPQPFMADPIRKERPGSSLVVGLGLLVGSVFLIQCGGNDVPSGPTAPVS